MSIDFPIDVVYTWVDGADPIHRELRARYRGSEHISSHAVCRWRDSHELRHSVDSVRRFAPWVRHIFVIVSLGQRPSFPLDNVQFIDDYDLFGPEYAERHLPVFNSHAIEAHVHQIPDLAEHFIYLCDDMFFGNQVSPADFFTAQGKMKIFLGEPLLKGRPTLSTPGWAAGRMNNSWVLDRFYGFAAKRQDCIHQARPVLKSVMEFMWEDRHLKPHLEATSASRFRGKTNLEPIGLAAQIALHLREAVPGQVTWRYVALFDQSRLEDEFAKLLLKRPQLYCVNDNMERPSQHHLDTLRYCYEHMLPHHVPELDDELDKWLRQQIQDGTGQKRSNITNGIKFLGMVI